MGWFQAVSIDRVMHFARLSTGRDAENLAVEFDPLLVGEIKAEFNHPLDCEIPPLGRQMPNAICGERTAKAGNGKVGAVGRHSGLLPPRFSKRTGINRVKACIIDETNCNPLRVRIVAGNGQCDPSRIARPRSAIGKTLRKNAVEGLDDGSAQLPLDPLALGKARLDVGDFPITDTGIIVPRFDNHEFIGDSIEHRPQFRDPFLGDGYYDSIDFSEGIMGRNRCYADLARNRQDAILSARVREQNFVSACPKFPREDCADRACADYSDPHYHLHVGQRRPKPLSNPEDRRAQLGSCIAR